MMAWAMVRIMRHGGWKTTANPLSLSMLALTEAPVIRWGCVSTGADVLFREIRCTGPAGNPAVFHVVDRRKGRRRRLTQVKARVGPSWHPDRCATGSSPAPALLVHRMERHLTHRSEVDANGLAAPEFLSAYALQSVPRYTSYPPANRFAADVDADIYRDWLGTVGAEDLSVYVHIPFCRSLCWYCGCHTTVPNHEARVSDYLDALHREIAIVGELVSREAQVRHLHFGGGTPNFMAPEALDALIQALKRAFSFHADAEIAMEADPRSLGDEHVSVLVRHAKPRISIGVQDVSADIQGLINRVQPFDGVAECVRRLRAAGVAGINVDLMYGLPGQTVEHVVRSAAMCAALEPDRFAVFGYAHVPWFKKNQKAIDETRLPGARERFTQSLAVRKTLCEQGYVPIGMDHYARPDDPLCRAGKEGQLRRNFQGYTTDQACTLIGLGASSIGAFRQGHVQNDPHLLGYRTALAENRLPVVRGVVLEDRHRLVGAVIERLMCDFTVDLGAIARAHGVSTGVFAPSLAALVPLVADGLVVVDGDVVQATPGGEIYIRNIAACFDDIPKVTGGRHAKAV